MLTTFLYAPLGFTSIGMFGTSTAKGSVDIPESWYWALLLSISVAGISPFTMRLRESDIARGSLVGKGEVTLRNMGSPYPSISQLEGTLILSHFASLNDVR